VITSILDSVKKSLNLADDYTAFDQDIIMHINSVFSTLNQLGVGPVEGFMIEDKTTTWDAFLGSDPRLNHIKSYVYLRVRLLFDPPTTGFTTEAMKEQIKELEWRINVQREDTEWTDPVTGLRPVGPVLDGGAP
jgi:hypothetical protein